MSISREWSKLRQAFKVYDLVDRKTRRLLKRVDKILKEIETLKQRFKALGKIDQLEKKIDLLEAFSHGARATYVGNNRVLTKAIIGGAQIAFYVEADDRLLSPWFIVSGTYETDVTEFFLRELKPDSHCIDVGTNFGYFTCLMANICRQGKVIGIEADETLRNLAQNNVFINSLHAYANVRHAAAGRSTEPLTLYRRNTRSGNTSIAKAPDSFIQELGEAPSEPFMVNGIRLDDLLPEMSGRVEFVKVDVEGAEPLVFEGARKMIETNPDINIVMEWSPGQIAGAGFSIERFLTDLETLGLQPHDLVHGGIKQISFAELAGSPYRSGIVLRHPRITHRQ